MSLRTRPVYVILFLLWGVIVLWQNIEHRRVSESARDALINRAKDISSTVGVVLRSQRHFGLISEERLESALNALIKTNELTAVALLNARSEVVASAGAPINLESNGLVPTGIHWEADTVALMNLVDLGTNVTADLESSRPTLVLSREDLPTPPTNRPPPPPRPEGDTPDGQPFTTPLPPPAPDAIITNSEGQFIVNTNRTDRDRDRDRDRGRDRDRRPRFGRPFWMTEEEYKAAIEKRGIHSFVMVLSTESMTATVQRDLWLRVVISGFASIAVLGFAFAWRNLTLNAELELRLVRASELNARLKEMNLAAAGLAHETRNPLNIIRGLAQIISRHADATPEVRDRSRSILDEADRVTAQLNEFINYSRPREVRRAAVNLGAVVGEIVRALASDLEDKAMKLEVAGDLPRIEADEQLLRQALFNLMLNAIQAGQPGGEIRVVAERVAANEIALDVRDNGPGVPADQRTEIFKPYVTNHADGTGLGLAVVQQIATAHGWEVQCLPNAPQGAIFRLSHIRPAGHA
jgi:signal transduction histidine kinase